MKKGNLSLQFILVAIFIVGIQFDTRAALASSRESSGWCCKGGELFDAEKGVCERERGRFYDNERQARNSCKPPQTGWCCKDGELFNAEKSECKRKKGRFYNNERQARNSCKPPQTGWCCKDGELFEAEKGDCKRKSGRFYDNERKARNSCKPPSTGWCCKDGELFEAEKGDCKRKSGRFYDNERQARNSCKPPNTGWCCKDGELFEAEKHDCIRKKGQFYDNERLGKNSCKPQITGWCCKDGELFEAEKRECERKKGRFFENERNGKTACQAFPQVESIKPDALVQGQLYDLHIIGKNFDKKMSLNFGSDIKVKSFKISRLKNSAKYKVYVDKTAKIGRHNIVLSFKNRKKQVGRVIVKKELDLRAKPEERTLVRKEEKPARQQSRIIDPSKIKLTPLSPDLTPTRIWAEQPTCRLWVEWENKGGAAPEKSFVERYSLNGSFRHGNTTMTSYTFDSGNKYPITAHSKLNHEVTNLYKIVILGKTTVEFTIDGTDVHAETDEDNNTLVKEITCTPLVEIQPGNIPNPAIGGLYEKTTSRQEAEPLEVVAKPVKGRKAPAELKTTQDRLRLGQSKAGAKIGKLEVTPSNSKYPKASGLALEGGTSEIKRSPDDLKPSASTGPMLLASVLIPIKITSPNVMNMVWMRGGTYAIEWTYAGKSIPKVDIKIRDKQNKKTLGTIKKNVVSSYLGGVYNWTIPSTYKEGDYVIRVQDAANGKVYGDSIPFKIKSGSFLTVTSPAQGDILENMTWNVKWNQTGMKGKNSKVDIILYRAGKSPYNIGDAVTGTGDAWYWAKGAPNSGVWGNSFSFVPGSLKIGDSGDGPYRLRVLSTDGVYGDSGVFSFEKVSISITSPVKDHDWVPLKTYTIQWDVTGKIAGNTFDINLISLSDLSNVISIVKNLKMNLSTSTYSYAWKVPGYLQSGKYVLQVASHITPKLMDFIETNVKAVPLQNGTGFLDQSDPAFKVVDVYYNSKKKGLETIIKNNGAYFDGKLSWALDLTPGDLFSATKPASSNKSSKWESLQFKQNETKTLYVDGWKIPVPFMDKYFIPQKGAVSIKLCVQPDTASTSAGDCYHGQICIGKKSDIVVWRTLSLAVDGKNDWHHIDRGTHKTISSSLIKWISNDTIEVKVNAEIINYGCMMKSFDCYLYADKFKGQHLGKYSLGPGKRTTVTKTVKIKLSTPIKDKWHQLVFVADHSEESDEAYFNSYMNNFVNVYIKIP